MEEEGALEGFLSRHRLEAPVQTQQLGWEQRGSARVHPHCWWERGSPQVPYQGRKGAPGLGIPCE